MTHSNPHLDETGACQCGCPECAEITVLVPGVAVGACICKDCPCGEQPAFVTVSDPPAEEVAP